MRAIQENGDSWGAMLSASAGGGWVGNGIGIAEGGGCVVYLGFHLVYDQGARPTRHLYLLVLSIPLPTKYKVLSYVKASLFLRVKTPYNSNMCMSQFLVRRRGEGMRCNGNIQAGLHGAGLPLDSAVRKLVAGDGHFQL